MGINCKENIIIKTQDEFHAIDKILMSFAFDIQNTMGKFCDEKIYQEVMARKCVGASIKACREIELIVSYKDFQKKYKLDLLVDNGVIYELKTVKALNNLHKQQLINYLLLTELKHGKLLNFRSGSVEYEYVSTSLTKKDRFNFSINTNKFIGTNVKSIYLKEILTNLLQQWGAYLDIHLYNEALIHFLGGSEDVITPVNIIFDDKIVGQQKMQLINRETIFHLSSINKKLQSYENNINRLVKHTNIKYVQWINFNKNIITLKTILKNDSVDK